MEESIRKVIEKKLEEAIKQAEQGLDIIEKQTKQLEENKQHFSLLKVRINTLKEILEIEKTEEPPNA